MTPAEMRRFFLRDRFARGAGMRLEEVRPGYARTRMTVSDRHLNAVDVAQGGAIFTLADLAFAACCNSHGTVAVAVNVSIQFVRAGRKGTLVAEAHEASVSPRLSSVDVRVTDRTGALVAIFTGLAYRKKETLDEVAAATQVRKRARRRTAERISSGTPGRGAASPRRGRAASRPPRPRG